jgi:hypothetical protein
MILIIIMKLIKKKSKMKKLNYLKNKNYSKEI